MVKCGEERIKGMCVTFFFSVSAQNGHLSFFLCFCFHSPFVRNIIAKKKYLFMLFAVYVCLDVRKGLFPKTNKQNKQDAWTNSNRRQKHAFSFKKGEMKILCMTRRKKEVHRQPEYGQVVVGERPNWGESRCMDRRVRQRRKIRRERRGRGGYKTQK